MVRGAYGIQRVVNVVSQTVSGLMHYLDKVKLDAATPANTASTIVQRDGAGGFAAGAVALAGSLTARAVTVGGAGASGMNIVALVPGVDAPASSIIYGSNAAGVAQWWITQAGQFSGNAASASLLGPGADKTKLDGATPANTANTLVQRDGTGGFSAGNIVAAGGVAAGGNLTAGGSVSAKLALIGGAGSGAGSVLLVIPASNNDAGLILSGTDASGNTTRWYITQDGHFSGWAGALGPGADRNKLDAIDPATTYPVVNGVTWCRTQIATGRSMFTAQVAVTLTGVPDQLVLNNITTPSSRALNTYDMFCAYHGRNGGQVNVSFRPVSNGEPDYNGNQFQVAISTSPQPASISPPDRTPVYTNLNQVGTTGVIHLMFIERA